MSDFEPYISAETQNIHYEKHYKGYLIRLRKLIQEKGIFKEYSLYDIMIESYGRYELIDIYNNAAQAYNHMVFWSSIAPKSETAEHIISDAAKKMIESSYSSIDNFRTNFIDRATSLFGNGWIWIVRNVSGKIEIMISMNAFNPLNIKDIDRIIIGIDLWEHAYYIDYRNERIKYITAIYDNLLRWKNFDNL